DGTDGHVRPLGDRDDRRGSAGFGNHRLGGGDDLATGLRRTSVTPIRGRMGGGRLGLVRLTGLSFAVCQRVAARQYRCFAHNYLFLVRSVGGRWSIASPSLMEVVK